MTAIDREHLDALLAGVLPDAPGWRDGRLAALRHNQFVYPAAPLATRAAWARRAAWVRERLRLAAGLLPAPPRPPLAARVWGEFEHEGCRVAKVRFQSAPGLWVTGNLYRPGRGRGPWPAILNPHGHWARGRFAHEPRGSVPARCLMQARLGFVAFSYDMLGYNDSRQLLHRWPGDLTRWAALWGLSPCGLQLWNSLRAVDWLCTRADVDSGRIGCTGTSGGASQTWTLAVLDPRVQVVVPVCMLSNHYQGGCQCEEAPLLRLGDLTTLDIARALAPRPALYPSVTGDWTNMNPVFEIPQLRAAYRLFGAARRVGSVHVDDGHNYNRRTREVAYAWFRRWLAGDRSVGRRIREPALAPLPESRARLFPENVRRADASDSRRVLARLARALATEFRAPPGSRAAFAALQRRFRAPYAGAFAAEGPEAEAADVAVRPAYRTARLPDGGTVAGFVLARRGSGAQVPALWMTPARARAGAPTVLAVPGAGKRSLFRGRRPGDLLRALLARGCRVLAIDAFGVGDTRTAAAEALPDPEDVTYHAFNPSLLAWRIADILAAAQALANYWNARQIHLLGTGAGARAALLAWPLIPGRVSAAVDLDGVVGGPAGWTGEAFHPMALRVGGLQGAVLLGAPRPLRLRRPEPALTRWARGVYRAAGCPRNLRVRGDLAALVP